MYYSINLDISMSNKAKSIDKKIFPQSMFSNLVLTKKTTSGRREIRRGGQKDYLKKHLNFVDEGSVVASSD